MTSTISTQPASNFFLITSRPHHTCSVSIAAYLSNMYSPLPLTKVPPGHCTSACPIPLIKMTTPTSFSILHDIGVHWAEPMINLVLAVHDSSFVQPLIVLLHLPFPILCHFCHFFPISDVYYKERPKDLLSIYIINPYFPKLYMQNISHNCTYKCISRIPGAAF